MTICRNCCFAWQSDFSASYPPHFDLDMAPIVT